MRELSIVIVLYIDEDSGNGGDDGDGGDDGGERVTRWYL